MTDIAEPVTPPSCATCKHYRYVEKTVHSDRCTRFSSNAGGTNPCYLMRAEGGDCEGGKCWEGA